MVLHRDWIDKIDTVTLLVKLVDNTSYRLHSARTVLFTNLEQNATNF